YFAGESAARDLVLAKHWSERAAAGGNLDARVLQDRVEEAIATERERVAAERLAQQKAKAKADAEAEALAQAEAIARRLAEERAVAARLQAQADEAAERE